MSAKGVIVIAVWLAAIGTLAYKLRAAETSNAVATASISVEEVRPPSPPTEDQLHARKLHEQYSTAIRERYLPAKARGDWYHARKIVEAIAFACSVRQEIMPGQLDVVVEEVEPAALPAEFRVNWQRSATSMARELVGCMSAVRAEGDGR